MTRGRPLPFPFGASPAAGEPRCTLGIGETAIGLDTRARGVRLHGRQNADPAATVLDTERPNPYVTASATVARAATDFVPAQDCRCIKSELTTRVLEGSRRLHAAFTCCDPPVSERYVPRTCHDKCNIRSGSQRRTPNTTAGDRNPVWAIEATDAGSVADQEHGEHEGQAASGRIATKTLIARSPCRAIASSASSQAATPAMKRGNAPRGP